MNGSLLNKFTGTLDGKGFEIIDYYTITTVPEGGVFRAINNEAEIKDIGMVNINITGGTSLVGRNNGNITNCYSTGIIYGGSGLVDINEQTGIITNSYSTADLYTYHPGQGYWGGLVRNNYGTINKSYSTGYVPAGLSSGGLVGYNPSAICTDSFWDNETSGQSGSACGTGKPTAEMIQQATYTNWDFTNTWQIDGGVSYPCLQWQGGVGSCPVP